MKILIIEDDKAIVRLLVSYLRRRGYETDVAFNGNPGYKMIKSDSFDLVILDLGLPDIDGLKLLEKIRRISDIPVLILTARGLLEEKISGLDLGADDYLVKPFDNKELQARIEALIRRDPTLVLKGNVLSASGLVMELKEHKVTLSGKEIELTKKEYALLEYLLRNKNKILSRLEILSHVWDQSVDTFTNTVDVHIASLRKKIENDKQDRIKTLHGVGYMFVDK